MVPRLQMQIVDVRDVAAMQVAALANPATEGQRVLAVAGALWFREMAAALKAIYPDRKIAMREAPTIVMRLLAVFDARIRAILPQLGEQMAVSNAKARALMGVEFIAPGEAIQATAQSLVAAGLAGAINP